MCPELRDRVGIHLTRYRQSHDEDYGRGWITLDGEQLLDASDFRHLFAENDEASPWEPYRVEHGFDVTAPARDASA